MTQKIIKPQTPKGFRDFLPEEARKRQFVLGKIRTVFESYGFEPLETPVIEMADTLLGKYGFEADKLLYLFKDRGNREIGLRYDLTVPLARVVAQYPTLPLPFKRYQIQEVFRAEKPQKGRFREFIQCDIDTIGTDSPLADAEIIECVLKTCQVLGFKNAKILVNDRTIFDELKLPKEAIIILDKLEKIGKEKVISELKNKGIKEPENLFSKIKTAKKTERLTQIFSLLKESGFIEGKDFVFSPFLARGLEYYTSTIFEVILENYQAGSVAGGGRYDNLIGLFTGRNLAAVGISFGIDRITEAMEELNLLPPKKSITQLLVTVFSKELLNKSLKVAKELRSAGINTEVYLEPEAKLDKQLKYADKKGIPYVVILGPNEIKQGGYVLKDMRSKIQRLYTNINELKANLNE